jgi:hypothetical protein
MALAISPLLSGGYPLELIAAPQSPYILYLGFPIVSPHSEVGRFLHFTFTLHGPHLLSLSVLALRFLIPGSSGQFPPAPGALLHLRLCLGALLFPPNQLLLSIPPCRTLNIIRYCRISSQLLLSLSCISLQL